MTKKKKKIPSKTSPKDDKRGCLCEDGSYSTECCDGSMVAQGIGALTDQSTSVNNSNVEVRTRTVNR